jgi:hypothetical protein
MKVTAESVSRASAELAKKAAISGSGANFMDNLKEMFLAPDKLLAQMADPEVTNITLGSLGTFDKNSPAFQLATAVFTSRNESAIQSVLSTIKFEYDISKSVSQLFG